MDDFSHDFELIAEINREADETEAASKAAEAGASPSDISDTASEAGSEDSTDSTSSKKRKGRPPAEVQKHFKRVSKQGNSSNRWNMQCNYCPAILGSARAALEQHIANECPKVSAEARQELLVEQGKRVDTEVADAPVGIKALPSR